MLFMEVTEIYRDSIQCLAFDWLALMDYGWLRSGMTWLVGA